MDREHLTELLRFPEDDLWEVNEALFRLRQKNPSDPWLERRIPLVQLALLVKVASRMLLVVEEGHR